MGQFRHAARNAMEAGFDGIELHAPPTATSSTSSSTPVNAHRWLRRITEDRLRCKKGDRAVAKAPIGLGCASRRFPGWHGGCQSAGSYLAAARLLRPPRNVACVAEAGRTTLPDGRGTNRVQGLPNTLIYAGKYTTVLSGARAAIRAGWADMIGFGRPSVANPADLPNPAASRLPVRPHDPATLFGGGGADRCHPSAEAGGA